LNDHPMIFSGDHVLDDFVEYCRQYHHERFLLVTDRNTWQALGARVEQTIRGNVWDLLHVMLNPEKLHTDDVSITRVLAQYDATPRLFVSVGSGTITDITRFTAHRSQNEFVCFPTAASVDAYTSRSSPTTIGDLKGSITCSVPKAIFTDIPTIVASPQFLTASGFADLVSKFTSSSDWKYTHMIWDVDFDEGIYLRALGAAQHGAKVAEGIARHDAASMAEMMEGQYESGSCMADFGNSAPASGGEHHIAHIWEMMFHWEGREGLYHGNAVGVATIFEAEWYERLHTLSKEEAATLLERARIPGRKEQEAAIRVALPQIAEELIRGNPILMQLTESQVLKRVRARILEHWGEIQSIAGNVPTTEQFRAWFKLLGAPTTPQELGLTARQVDTAVNLGHYLRERFSINVIRTLFGWQ